jgi:hypothetical protein
MFLSFLCSVLSNPIKLPKRSPWLSLDPSVQVALSLSVNGCAPCWSFGIALNALASKNFYSISDKIAKVNMTFITIILLQLLHSEIRVIGLFLSYFGPGPNSDKFGLNTPILKLTLTNWTK